MKKGMKLTLFAAAFATALCGCGKKESSVADDFKDVQGTTATETDVNDTEGNQDISYDSDEGELEYEIVDLPVDATVTYGDKKADLHFDLQEWSSDIGGPIEATESKVDEAYMENLVSKVFDDGKYTIQTEGATPGQLLTESKYTQGSIEEKYVSCDLLGTVDGVDMEFYYSDQIDGSYQQSRYMSIYKVQDEMSMGWMEMSDDEVQNSGGNACDKNEALQTAENYLKRWGFEDYECVADSAITDASSETTKADGYQFVFRKKIGKSVGAPYESNCFYDHDNPYPTFFETITVIISSNGLINVSISDMYEVGENKQEATLIGKDEAIEKGTKAIEEYLKNYGEDYYIIWVYEHKSVWNVFVDLSYVPIKTEEGVSYRAVYVFSVEDPGYASRIPLTAIDAETGTTYTVDYMYSPDSDAPKG